jgi:hypothetical protein
VAGDKIELRVGPELWDKDFERRKNNAAAIVRTFRTHLIRRDLIAARSALKDSENSELAEFVAADLPLMRSLVELATAADDADLVELVKQTAAWQNECAAAYLMSYRRLYRTKANVLRDAYSYVPVSSVTDGVLHAELLKAAQSFPEAQTLVWPLVRNLVVPDHNEPFRYEQAEVDQSALFGVPYKGRQPAYWPRHNLFAVLSNSGQPRVVFGERGSGRTAMSLALGKYAIASRFRLSLYLPGQPAIAEIMSGYARVLLDFVQSYPTHLSKLSASERALLARVLISGPGKEYVLSEIEAARASDEWSSLVIADSRPDSSSPGEAQFDLLSNEIKSVSSDRLDETQWPWAINRCARALGFERKQVILVIDSVSTDTTWLTTFIVPRLARWLQAGLIAIVFAPQLILDGGFNIEDGVTQVSSLKWMPDQFRSMLRHRYTSLLGRRHQIEEAFVDQLLFDALMRGSRYNPRNFVHLWNACRHELGDGAKIDAASVKTVFERESLA